MKNHENNWLEIVGREFDHPATVLWRAVELRYIEDAFFRHNLLEPVLDLGCAEGKIADALFKKNTLIGLDNCWELIRQNKKEAHKALVLADGCKTPFKDEVFGSIFSNCVIEHIPGLDSLLVESYRLLKPGGIFLFTVPSDKFGDFLFFHVLFKRLGMNSLANRYSKMRNSRLCHFHCYSHQVWQEKLEAKGFELVEYVYYMPKEALMRWDFLAGIVFIFGKIKISSFLKRKFTQELKPVFDKYTKPDCDIGGSLLIVAQKNS